MYSNILKLIENIARCIWMYSNLNRSWLKLIKVDYNSNWLKLDWNLNRIRLELIQTNWNVLKLNQIWFNQLKCIETWFKSIKIDFKWIKINPNFRKIGYKNSFKFIQIDLNASKLIKNGLKLTQISVKSDRLKQVNSINLIQFNNSIQFE